MKISLKLILVFLLVAILPIILLEILNFNNAKNTLEVEIITKLESIADLKVIVIEELFEDFKSDILVMQSNHNVLINFLILNEFLNDMENPKWKKSKQELDSHLQTFQKIKGFEDIMFINTEDIIVYSSNPSHFSKEIGNKYSNEEILTIGKNGIYLSKIFYDDVIKNNIQFLSAPLFSKNETFIGLIIFELNIDFIYDIIQETTGLGETGETLIGRNEGDYALFLNPLRHDPLAGLSRKALFSDESAFPVKEAVQGRDGSGLSIDYRNIQIIAAWRHIPALNWGLVAKIDTSEAFHSIIKLKTRIFILGIIIILLVIIFSLFTINSILTPIKKLNKSAIEISKGNLDTKIEINSKDEVGSLANSLEEMRKEVRKSRKNLEFQVSKKTIDLNARIKDLEALRDLTTDSEIYAEKMRVEKEKISKNLKNLEKENDKLTKKLNRLKKKNS